MIPTSPSSPTIAIGGMGGSGTRLVAALVQELGVDMGTLLNGALDNLAFTLFLKRPKWFSTFPLREEIQTSLDLFHAHMTADLATINGQDSLTLIDDIVYELHAHPTPIGADEQTAKRLLKPAEEDIFRSPSWGWKEPNTHVFLPEIFLKYPNIKYIHVIRHGLDMAFSQNQQQLINWEHKICPENSNTEKTIAVRSLDFWIASTKRAIELGAHTLGSNFHLLNYDAFCATPSASVDLLADFLGVEISGDERKRLMGLFAPISIGRFKNEDLSQFSKHQLEEVQMLGFSIA